MKIIASAVVCSFLIATLCPADARPNIMAGRGYGDKQRNKGMGGTCPVGTCSNSGGSTATKLNNCKPSNCRR